MAPAIWTKASPQFSLFSQGKPEKRSKSAVAAALLVMSAILGLAPAPAMAEPGHECLEAPDMQQLKACFENLPTAERRGALERHFLQIATRFPKENPPSEQNTYVTIQLNDESANLTRNDAIPLYRKLRAAFVSAWNEAKASGKQLIFLAGESHDDRSDLMLGSMLTLIANRLGVTEFGFEVAEESLVRGQENPVHYRGLWETLEAVADMLPARPEEAEPLVNSYLGGARHNREFEIWLLLSSADRAKAPSGCMDAACWREAGGEIGNARHVFAADPQFWNWERYPNLFGYQLTREPTMAKTLIEQALASESPVIAFYGMLHLQAIADLVGQSGLDSKLEMRFLNFSQKVYIFNTDVADPVAKENAVVWNARVLRALQNYREDENFIRLEKRGPTTAEQALDFAIYADCIAGSKTRVIQDLSWREESILQGVDRC